MMSHGFEVKKIVGPSSVSFTVPVDVSYDSLTDFMDKIHRALAALAANDVDRANTTVSISHYESYGSVDYTIEVSGDRAATDAELRSSRERANTARNARIKQLEAEVERLKAEFK